MKHPCIRGVYLLQLGGYRPGAQVKWALIDEADYERAKRFRWSFSSRSGKLGGIGYAMRKTGGRKNTTLIYLHRYLFGLEKGDPRCVDHINRNTLDCRRANLRLVSFAENVQNQNLRGGASLYRGVSRGPRGEGWRARVKLNGRERHLGVFDTEMEAAEIAAKYRRRLLVGAVD
jgi:hypothetical protein